MTDTAKLRELAQDAISVHTEDMPEHRLASGCISLLDELDRLRTIADTDKASMTCISCAPLNCSGLFRWQSHLNARKLLNTATNLLTLWKDKP